jgi:uncharacterized protein (TIGR00251 family)
VRVSPASRRNEVVGRHGSAWKVSVVAPPERGLANAAVAGLVAAACGVPKADVRVVIGHGARDKVIEIQGVTSAEAERRLAASQRKGRE